jgi:hypothetical protein
LHFLISLSNCWVCNCWFVFSSSKDIFSLI